MKENPAGSQTHQILSFSILIQMQQLNLLSSTFLAMFVIFKAFTTLKKYFCFDSFVITFIKYSLDPWAFHHPVSTRHGFQTNSSGKSATFIVPWMSLLSLPHLFTQIYSSYLDPQLQILKPQKSLHILHKVWHSELEMILQLWNQCVIKGSSWLPVLHGSIYTDPMPSSVSPPTYNKQCTSALQFFCSYILRKAF